MLVKENTPKRFFKNFGGQNKAAAQVVILNSAVRYVFIYIHTLLQLHRLVLVLSSFFTRDERYHFYICR